MWTGLLWLGLLAAAGLCYPRRPRTAGALWIALGTWYLVKYRNPYVRAKHVDYWKAKA